jgi:hypothetical protein
VVILVVRSHARKVSDDGNPETLEMMLLPNARSLKNLRGAQCTRSDDDHFPGCDARAGMFAEAGERSMNYIRFNLKAYCTLAIKDDTTDQSFREDVKVWVFSTF